MSRELRRYGPNLLITPAQTGRSTGAGAPTLDEDTVRSLTTALRAPGSTSAPAISPVLIASGRVRPPSRAEAEALPAQGLPSDAGERDLPAAAAAIIGADFAALKRVYPSWHVQGAWPDESGGECLAGEALAQRAGLAPGRRALVQVGSAEGAAKLACRISGVISTGEVEDQELFVPLGALQERTGLGGRVSLAAVSVDGGIDAVSAAAAQAQRLLPAASARPLRQIAAAQGAILGKLQRMMVLLTAVVLVLTSLCLVTTLMAIVVERQSEIGLMRSLGAADLEILEMFLGEVGLLGLLGSAIGIALGAAGAYFIGARLFGAAITPRAEVIPMVIAISLGLCLLSVLIPLRRALSVQPAAALRGD
jgi:putative ABC transport system permease protein